jgi:4-hydroxy 2-oxovalerate aldolase
MKIGVMVNASELFTADMSPEEVINHLFKPAAESPVSLVRFACHIHEFKDTLPICNLLKEMGYIVGINLMQISEASDEEIISLGIEAENFKMDVLYFADSLGSLLPSQVKKIIKLLQKGWSGPIGIHTHDNMNQALSNTHEAVNAGATWIDSTVTGMGRGPGNAKTEFTAIEFLDNDNNNIGLQALSSLISEYFSPMKNHYGWGTNLYYYLAGKFKIHPTYIQEMLNDERYKDEDILSLIDHLKNVGGKKFNHRIMETGRLIFNAEASGSWSPSKFVANRDVLIIGSGPTVIEHKGAIEAFIQKFNPCVIALNTNNILEDSLIDLRAACHPLRVVADINHYKNFSQPLVLPFSQLPTELQKLLEGIEILDYGITIKANIFSFEATQCSIPLPLVLSYALAVASIGGAEKIYLAGMDGYGSSDRRSSEMDVVLKAYSANSNTIDLISITPTSYDLASSSVYAL